MICLVNSDNERDSIILNRYLSAAEMLKLFVLPACPRMGGVARAVEFHLIVWPLAL